MKTGIIVATKSEEAPFYDFFGKPNVRLSQNDGYNVAIWETNALDYIYLVVSGYGEIAAASTTQYLIDKFRVNRVINYGVVGGLTEEYAAGQIGVIKSIVHYDFDASLGGKHVVGKYPNQEDLFIAPKTNAISSHITKDLPKFICASADKVVGGGEPKRSLNERYGANICEMEAAGIVITCNRNNIPCSFIKAISDGVDEDEEAFAKNVTKASRNCIAFIATII